MKANILQVTELKGATDKIAETNKTVNRKLADNFKNQVHDYTNDITNFQKEALDVAIDVSDDYYELQRQLLNTFLSAWKNGMMCCFPLVGFNK